MSGTPINETILYGIDVQPSDFVLVNPYQDYTETDFETYSNDESYDYNKPNSQRRNYTTADNAIDRDGQGNNGEYMLGKKVLVNMIMGKLQ